jgi:hypothetical protein
LDLRASAAFGHYSANAVYRPTQAGAPEVNFREQILGALRVTERGQLALVVPFVETYRRSGMSSEFGGNLADINASARYDITLEGNDDRVPGIALLLGVSLPTGTSVEAAENVLATDATGSGTYQYHLGLAMEQSYGPWLLALTGTFAYRAPRRVQGIDSALSPEWTVMAALAHNFANGTALALLVSQTLEGNAEVMGKSVPNSGRSNLNLGVSSLLPLSEDWRLNTALSLTPPFSELGKNSLATGGATLTLVRTWS